MLYSSRDDLVYSDPGHRPEENSGWARKLVSGKQKKNLKKVKTTNFGRSSVNCDDPFIIGRDRVRHTYAYFSHLFSFFSQSQYFLFRLMLRSYILYVNYISTVVLQKNLRYVEFWKRLLVLGLEFRKKLEFLPLEFFKNAQKKSLV